MNGNGYIDYTEFLAASLHQTIFLKEENLRQAFSYFDRVSFIFYHQGPKWKNNYKRVEEDSAERRSSIGLRA